MGISRVGSWGLRSLRSLPSMAAFDVMGWNDNYRDAWRHVELEPPSHLSHWTRKSITEGGAILIGDASGFLRYSPCPVPSDLQRGFPEKFVGKPVGYIRGIEVVVSALRHAGIDVLKGGIITFRNNLNKICGTVIDPKQEWVVGACMLSESDTLFLDIESTGKDDSFPDSERFTYYGYKFETLCTGGGDDGQVDCTSESAVVVKSKFNDLDIMMAAEVDACDINEVPGKEGTPDLETLVELKTSRMPKHPKQRQAAQKYKYPKWWLQSMLAGVPRIVVGYWEDDGTIRELRTFETKSLPSLSRQNIPHYYKAQMWDPDQILSFGLHVMEWMKAYVVGQRDTHILFRYDPNSKIISGSISPNGDLTQRIRSALEGTAILALNQQASARAEGIK